MKSMTGFGRSNLIENQRQYQVEIRSVNHKYNDISIKMPRSISFLEENIKNQIAKKVKRGKVDVFIKFENNSQEGKSVYINKEIAKLYIDNLKELAEEENINKNIEVTDIIKLPDVLNIENTEPEEIIKKEMEIAVGEALDKLIQMRIFEGEKISQDLKKRIENIKHVIDKLFRTFYWTY